jgi:RNA polymerase sigma-70 factor, ECF subfamily
VGHVTDRGGPWPARPGARTARTRSLLLQAAIASLQIQEPVDWPQIVALYDQLVRLTGSPVVDLNRAVAVAQAGSPTAALDIIDGLPLDNYPYLHSTRAELLRRLGRTDEARAAYHRALELTPREPERRFLHGRITVIRVRRINRSAGWS